MQTFLIFPLLAQHSWSRISMSNSPQIVLALMQKGIAADDMYIGNDGRIRLELTADEIEKIVQLKIDYQMEVEDLGAYYTKRNVGLSPEQILTNARNFKGTKDVPIPVNFSLGSMGGFSTLDQIMNHLDTMKAKFPNLISAKQTVSSGSTHEGRSIYWVRISDNPEVDENEPEVLYTALHHAREPIGSQQMLFYMYYILENYANNAEIKKMIDTTELYFIPCVNPDGYEYNRAISSTGGGSWRKNRRDNGGSYGVDLNRNYGFMWGYDDIGSSPDPTGNTYRGPSAFSEPETQMISDFCIAHQFRIVLNYHSYGNWLLNPWGYIYEATPDQDIFDAFNYDFTAENAFIAGPASLLLYAVNGGSDDWMYAEQNLKPKILAYTPEVGSNEDGFWPQVSRILPLCQLNVDQNIKAAQYSGWYGKIKDLTPEVYSSKQNYVKFSAQRYGLQEIDKYRIYIEPVSANIISVGDTVNISNPLHLQMYIDSLYLELSSSVANGEYFQFNLHMTDGVYDYVKNITKIYGSPLMIFSDNCSDMSKWNSTSWNVAEFNFFSPPFSITDSKYGNYGSNVSKSITLKEGIELPANQPAVLYFKSWYEIERGYDYVQLDLSTDNGSSWITLSCNNTRPGTAMQTGGQAVFDGNSNTWINNEIQLGDWAGHTVKFRFTLKSNYSINKDGFYFDDVEVHTFSNNTAISTGHQKEAFLGYPSPNPASTYLSISYTIEETDRYAIMLITDSQGRILQQHKIPGGNNTLMIDTHELEAGVYFIQLQSKQGKFVRKMIVQ